MAKIAIFMNSLAGGGMERAMLNLANYLANQGASVDLLVASARGPLLSEIPDTIRLIDLSSSRHQFESVRLWCVKAAFSIEPWLVLLILASKLPKAIKSIPVLIHYLENSSTEIMLCTPTTANLSALWARAYCKSKIKIAIREASTLSKEIEFKKSTFFCLMKRFVQRWYKRADMIITVSDGVKEDLMKNFQADGSKIKSVFNILDIEKIKNQSISKEHDLMIDSYGKFLLSIGRLESQKDFGTLIRAFHKLSNRLSVNLVILGEGSMRCELENLVEELSLQKRVYMPGFVLNPYPFLARSEVLVLSSKWEGAPNVLREAVVLNKKIVSTDCPYGPSEILRDVEHSRLVKVGDHKTLADAIIEMLEMESSNIKCSNNIENINKDSECFYKQLFAV